MRLATDSRASQVQVCFSGSLGCRPGCGGCQADQPKRKSVVAGPAVCVHGILGRGLSPAEVLEKGARLARSREAGVASLGTSPASLGRLGPTPPGPRGVGGGRVQRRRELQNGAGCPPPLCPWTGQEVVTDLGERQCLTQLPSGQGGRGGGRPSSYPNPGARPERARQEVTGAGPLCVRPCRTEKPLPSGLGLGGTTNRGSYPHPRSLAQQCNNGVRNTKGLFSPHHHRLLGQIPEGK